MTISLYSTCKIDSLTLHIFRFVWMLLLFLFLILLIFLTYLFSYHNLLLLLFQFPIPTTFAITPFFRCYIHSEIPYEDQTKAFQPAPSGKIKIIIANNTAVSSITFPDVDTVVCFGTHKSLKYSQDSHGTYLANTWISKMTAIQRAGRTGRVRPGTVYRLHTEDLSARLDDEDVSEIFRYDKLCLKIT